MQPAVQSFHLCQNLKRNLFLLKEPKANPDKCPDGDDVGGIHVYVEAEMDCRGNISIVLIVDGAIDGLFVTKSQGIEKLLVLIVLSRDRFIPGTTAVVA